MFPGDRDHTRDEYALGISLMEMLGADIPSVQEKLSSDTMWNNESADDIPEELIRICKKASSPKCEDRYQSAAEMQHDLAAWLKSDMKGENSNPTRKKIYVIAGIAAVFFLVLGIIIGMQTGFIRIGKGDISPETEGIVTTVSDESEDSDNAEIDSASFSETAMATEIETTEQTAETAVPERKKVSGSGEIRETAENADAVKMADYNQSNSITKLESSPFYGIFMYANKEYSKAVSYSEKASASGIENEIIVTNDWSKLNSEKYYAVTAGRYSTKEKAENNLAAVQKYSSKAYVKYTGTYQGNNSFRVNYYITDADNLTIYDSNVVWSGGVNGAEADLVVDEDTVFDSSCDMQYFSHYENGMTVLEWNLAAAKASQADSSDMGALGVFDVQITGNHVDSIYGIYWWD